ncbi:MAG: DUF1488 domain-containing protein [Vibrio sp.]
MNQAIIFSDDVTWNEKDQQLIFIAQVSGQVVECVVSHQKLQQLAQKVVHGVEDAFVAFEVCRFDLEEEAETLIQDEAYNEFGQVIL